MTDLNEKILAEINRLENVNSLSLAKTLSVDHQKIVSAIKSLQCHDGVITVEMETVKKWELTKEGEMVAEKGRLMLQLTS